MKRITIIIVLFISTLGITQTSTSLIGRDSINHRLLDSLIIVAVNNQRSIVKSPALKYNPVIFKFASDHSVWMSVNNKYEHSNPAFREYAECLAAGFMWERTSYIEEAEMIVNGWMNSPRHKAILLDKQYTECGTHTLEYVDTSIKSVLYGFDARSTFCLK